MSQETTITLPLGDLGPLGLDYAADCLEDMADLHRAAPLHMVSLQQVADMLRFGAAKLRQAENAE